ncbi:MAG: dihydroorotase [Proteobacteria bacterium]|nr:dihydroorotase [Pseudomonadota bacterium]
MKVLIRGGRLIDPAQGLDGLYDLLLKDGKVADVSPAGKGKSDVATVIDADGLLVIPGIIDIHTHLRDPGYEYKEDIESGTLAAAAGGVTAVACMANTKPVNDNAAITQDILKKAGDTGHVRVYPIGAMTKGLAGKELAEIASMKSAGIVAVSDDGMPVVSSEMMRVGLEYCRPLDLTVISHPEDLGLSAGGSMNEGYLSTIMGLKGIPRAAEDVMVMRDIALAQLTGAKLHIAHISTAGIVSLVREAKRRGIRVTAEAAPHHFSLTEDAVKGYRTDAKMSPPLRESSDIQAIKEGLKDGTIDLIATDHAPHSTIEKDVEFDHAANGIIGLETLLPLTLRLVDEGVLSLTQMVEKLSVNPAAIIGVEGGSLKKGMPADITIIDPEMKFKVDRKKMKSKSKNTPFHGWEMKGKAVYTIVDGKVVYKEDNYD